MKAILKVGIVLTAVIGLLSTACQSGTGKSEQKTESWQHYGVCLKGEPTIYQSSRTNKSEIGEVMFDRVPQFGEFIKVTKTI